MRTSQKAGKNDNDRVASSDGVAIHLELQQDHSLEDS